jgi:hypothetical protein
VRWTLLLLAAAGCGTDATLVVANRLAPGGGGVGVQARPAFDVVVRIEHDASEFRAQDIMRLLVDGADRASEAVMGGNYAVLRIAPPPPGAHFVELFRRRDTARLDAFTWNVAPYAGPTLTGAAPASGPAGTTVTLTGTGFDAGAPRVFFGGVEAAVTASTATTIEATVPVGALPGPVFVLIGPDAAEGLVDFLPLDGSGAPVPQTTARRLFALFPARGPRETPVRFYGVRFDIHAETRFNGDKGQRPFDIRTETLPNAGAVLSAFAVVDVDTPSGAGTFQFERLGELSNALPFTVE